MSSSILPLSDVPKERVIEFLVDRGIPRERALWKYYDDRFNRGRNRGFAWFKDEDVKGFIGIIPCVLSTPSGDVPMVWTCDWFLRDPRATPGMGILLLRKVHAAHAVIGAVGGTADTAAALPNMDTRTVENAAVVLHRPLKLSGILEKVESRLPRLPRLSGSALGSIRLPHAKPRVPVTIEDGVSPLLEPLFEQPQPGGWRVRYDHDYVDWQVGRCPGLRSRSIVAMAGETPVAGAVLWSLDSAPRNWRAVIRALPGHEAMLRAVISAALDEAARAGGALLSTIVSHLDGGVLASLRRQGFVAGERQPLYVTPEQSAPEQGFADLSYLDTDLASLP
jgi:hypothetical protein